MLLHEFGDDAAVAPFRRRLAAEEHCLGLKSMRVEDAGDAALHHQVAECGLVLGPGDLLLPVGVEHRLRRREAQIVLVRSAADRFEEVGEVLGLRETRELRGVVQSYVQESADSSSLEALEEVAR